MSVTHLVSIAHDASCARPLQLHSLIYALLLLLLLSGYHQVILYHGYTLPQHLQQRRMLHHDTAQQSCKEVCVWGGEGDLRCGGDACLLYPSEVAEEK